MRRSHKARLATVSTAVAAGVLGTVFVGVTSVARAAQFEEEREEMERSFLAVSGTPLRYFSLKELGEAGPTMSARVTALDGRSLAARGRMPDPPAGLTEGFAMQGTWMYLARHTATERVLIGQNVKTILEGEQRLALALALLWIPLSMLVGGATWLAAGSVFRPLDRLAESAAALEGTDLSQRLPPPDEAEFGALAVVLNRMLARIEEAALRSERFAADAAHELRTPLAVVRAQIETTLLRARTPPEYVASHEALLEEIDRLSSIVEALLCSARAPLEPALALDLVPLVRETAARHAIPGLRLDLREAWATVRPEEVAIVLDNLLDNASRLAPRGEIVLSLASTGEGAELRVVDHGPGIGREHRPRVFERLYRADEGRSRASGGAGIGLAVCRRLVEGRGGTIVAEETPGGGATMVVRWPRT